MLAMFPRRHRADQRSGVSAIDHLPTLQAVLCQWIRGRARPEAVLIDPDEGITVRLEQVLTRVRESSARLEPGCAPHLGLPESATFADAADALLFARRHPDGPRCRSFRSASYYLYGLARIDAEGDQLDSDDHPESLQPTTEPSTWISEGATNGRQPGPDPSPQDGQGRQDGSTS